MGAKTSAEPKAQSRDPKMGCMRTEPLGGPPNGFNEGGRFFQKHRKGSMLFELGQFSQRV